MLHLALTLGLVVRWVMAPADRERTRYVTAALIFATLLVQCTLPIIGELGKLRPVKYDLYVFESSKWIGLPSFAIGQLVYSSHALISIVTVTYGVLHLAIVVAFTATLYLRPQQVALLIRCFLMNLILALPIYLLIPVSGPAYAFPGFPRIPQVGAAHPILLAAIPNGIPSVHMSSALLVLWFLRHWRAGRVFGSVFVLLTALATMGKGEHYLLDLVIAVPYAALVYWVCTREVFARADGTMFRRFCCPEQRLRQANAASAD